MNPTQPIADTIVWKEKNLRPRTDWRLIAFYAAMLGLSAGAWYLGYLGAKAVLRAL